MPEVVKSTLKRAEDFFQNTEKKKFILPAVLTALVIALGITGAVLLNRVTYTVLYSGLSAEESGKVMAVLEEMGVGAKPKGTDTILVPKEKADELRIALAAQGYPDTGLNYDLFSKSSALGSTDLERQTYLKYQLQENMRATISRMNKVKDCVVIVNLATASSFVLSSNVSEASAAVLLDLQTGETLTVQEAKSIGQFVIKCVPKLTLENVSIVDSDMRHYDLSSEEGAAMPKYSESQQELTEQMKEILSGQVLRVLEPALGEGNVSVSVNLSLNFDKETVQSVVFAPPLEGETHGMLISSEELYDALTSGLGGAAAGQPGTDSNGVSAPEYVYGGSGSAGESYSKIYNYELNRIQTQIEKAQGAVQELSVAVLVNSQVEGAAEYSDTMKKLVASAIGVNPDYISVELMPFVGRADAGGFDEYLRQNQAAVDKLRQTSLIKTALIAAAVLAAAALVVRGIGKKRMGQDSAVLVTEGGPLGGAIAAEFLDDAETKAEQERLLQELITKKSDEAEKVEELIDRYPEATVQILRSWLMEDN